MPPAAAAIERIRGPPRRLSAQDLPEDMAPAVDAPPASASNR
ncbi:hypothetical protein L489_5620 [Bordetella bronchiseptica 00-P-2730]|nr:hypothetical protein L489_5620 [Bordetella bronchiseptica 00-P-2730]KFJ59366.1 hypothetical protein DK45_2695 [Bordetella bronchiseptica]